MRSLPIDTAAAMPRPTTSPTTDVDVPRGDVEDVVPVASDLAAAAGHVPGRELEALDDRQLRRQEAALERRRGSPRHLDLAGLGREGHAVARELQQLGLLVV